MPDMNLAAAARLLRVLLKRRLKDGGAKVHARQLQFVHRRRKPVGVNPRRANQLERPGRSPTFRKHYALEQHGAGVHDGGIERGHVGRWHHPRQARLIPVHVPMPPFHRRDFEIRADVEVIVEEPGQLPNRHPVPHRYRKLPDKRLEATGQRGTLDLGPADRVRPIAHDDRDTVPGRGAHAVGHGVDVGIDPGADILEVNHQNIQSLKHFWRRLACIAIQRIDRHPPRRIVPVRRFDHVVLHVGAKAVLRAENRGQLHARFLSQPVNDMAERVVDRGMVADNANAGTPQMVGAEQYIRTEPN